MSKKSYSVGVKVPNSRGQLVDKTLTFVKGDKVSSVEMPKDFLGQVAFHTDDNNGVIYDCYARISGIIGGKLKVDKGLAEAPNGDWFIIEAVEKKDGDKLVSQAFDIFKAVNA